MPVFTIIREEKQLCMYGHTFFKPFTTCSHIGAGPSYIQKKHLLLHWLQYGLFEQHTSSRSLSIYIHIVAQVIFYATQSLFGLLLLYE